MNLSGADILSKISMKPSSSSERKQRSFEPDLELMLHRLARRVEAGMPQTDEEHERTSDLPGTQDVSEAELARADRLFTKRLDKLRQSRVVPEVKPLSSLRSSTACRDIPGRKQPEATEPPDSYVSALLTLPSYRPGMSLEDLIAPGVRGLTILHRAAWAGELRLIPGLCLTGENLTIADAYGRTPLHLAAASGHLGQVPSETLNLTNLTIKDRVGESPLLLAARSGTLEQVFGRSPDRRREAWRRLATKEAARWREDLNRYEPLPEGVAEIISKPRPRRKSRLKRVPLLAGFREFCRRLQRDYKGFFTKAQVNRLIKGASYRGNSLQAHEIKTGWGISRLGDGPNWRLDLRKVYNCLVKAGNIVLPPSDRSRASKKGKEEEEGVAEEIKINVLPPCWEYRRHTAVLGPSLGIVRRHRR
jgi:hypothetical protein